MPTRIDPLAQRTLIAGQPTPGAPAHPPQPLAIGPPGPAGESAYQRALANGFVGTEAQWLASLAATAPRYRHDQTVPATTWTVNHNLGFVPQVEVYNAGSQRLPLAAVANPNVNQSIITFNAATSGFALCQ